MKTDLKKATRPKPRPSKGFRGVNSRAEALENFENADLLNNPNFAGKINSSSTTKKTEGGMVTGSKNGGCVMAGRGSKYKGMK